MGKPETTYEQARIAWRVYLRLKPSYHMLHGQERGTMARTLDNCSRVVHAYMARTGIDVTREAS